MYWNSNISKGNHQQISISIDKQKQSLHYSYETLLHLLSAAENFADLKNEQYEAYNISTAKTYEELKSEFVLELHCFQVALKIYNKTYGKYKFHNELPKEKILADIERYIKRVDENDKILYYAMMNLILEKKIDIDFDELLDELDENPNQSFDPNKLKNLIGPINHILYKIEENSENPNNEYVIRKFKSKSIEQLINESKKERIKNNIEQAYIGKEGYLYKSDDMEKKYFFYYKDNFFFNHDLIFKEIIRESKLYEIKNMDAFLFFRGKKFYTKRKNRCILFKKINSNFNSQNLQLIEQRNGFSIFINNSTRKYILLFDENSEDFK